MIEEGNFDLDRTKLVPGRLALGNTNTIVIVSYLARRQIGPNMFHGMTGLDFE